MRQNQCPKAEQILSKYQVLGFPCIQYLVMHTSEGRRSYANTCQPNAYCRRRIQPTLSATWMILQSVLIPNLCAISWELKRIGAQHSPHIFRPTFLRRIRTAYAVRSGPPPVKQKPLQQKYILCHAFLNQVVAKAVERIYTPGWLGLIQQLGPPVPWEAPSPYLFLRHTLSIPPHP